MRVYEFRGGEVGNVPGSDEKPPRITVVDLA
jgi:hypothetical protein